MPDSSVWINGWVLLFLGVGSWFDIKSKELPVAFLQAFGIWGIVCNFMLRYQSFKEVLAGIGIGLLFLVIGKLTEEAIGYGDGYGIMILGVFLGWKMTAGIVCLALILSALYGVYRIILGKGSMKERMAFFPFMFLSAAGGIWL